MTTIATRTQTNLNMGQASMVDKNYGKKVTVSLLSEDKELIIHNGVNIMGVFRYVMHTAKRPRKSYVYDANCAESTLMHLNMDAGYYLVDPMNIIL